MGRSFKSPSDQWHRLYDAQAWKDYRLRYLKVNSKCYACGNHANVVDHLVPHQGDEKLFKKNDNHIPLCEFCHNKVTMLFDIRHKAGNNIDKKVSWLVSRRMEKMLTFRVRVIPYDESR